MSTIHNNKSSNLTYIHAVVADSLVGTGEQRALRLELTRASLEATEVLVSQLHQLVVVNSTSSSDDETIGSVVGLGVVQQVLASQVLDVLVRAQDGAAQTSAHEGSAVKLVKDDLLVLLADLDSLTKDHITLSVDSGFVQKRVLKDISQDLDGLGDVVLEHTSEVDSLLARGVSVQVATHVLNLHFQLLLGTALGSLEGHVLQEVSGTVVLVGLVSASSVDPNTNSGSLAVRSLIERTIH